MPTIVDAHTDLLLELVHRRAEPDPFGSHWLPGLRDGGVALQVVRHRRVDREISH